MSKTRGNVAADPNLQRAVTAHRAGDLAGAERGYRAVLKRGEHPTALANLGLILWRRGAAVEGEALLRRAIKAAPAAPGAHYNLGNLLMGQRRLEEARAAYRATQALAPDFPGLSLNLGNLLLMLGEQGEGWALYDQRPERLAAATHALAFPEWRGEPLAGKRLYVWGEQGFGDQIFAARYLAGLGTAAVTYACPLPLARLFGQLPVQVAPRHGELHVAPHDYWTLPLSIPRWTGERPVAPYLSAGASGRGRIGIAWRGNATPDPHRSLPPDLGAQLLALPGAVGLHPDESGARDFQDTAEIIAGLDLVVSVDTSVAHLAGAMGKPTYVMLQHLSADWRWEQAWYPNVTLLRQPAPGDWASVIAAVAAL